jgi:hypothetical protein
MHRSAEAAAAHRQTTRRDRDRRNAYPGAHALAMAARARRAARSAASTSDAPGAMARTATQRPITAKGVAPVAGRQGRCAPQ